MSCFHIPRDHGGSFRESIPLQHGYTQGIKEFLKLYVKQCRTAEEESQPSAKAGSYFLEQDYIIQQIKRFKKYPESFSLVPSDSIIPVSNSQCMIEELFYKRTLFPDALLNSFAKAFCQGRRTQQENRLNLTNIARQILKALKIGLPKLNSCKAGTDCHHNVDPDSVSERMVPRKNQQCSPPFRNIEQCKSLFYVCSI